eukprot:jgi/Psemu1/304175/fgenesh1_kg.138_\
MVLYDRTTGSENSKPQTLINEYKDRVLFVCELEDKDFPTAVRSTANEHIVEREMLIFCVWCGNLFYATFILHQAVNAKCVVSWNNDEARAVLFKSLSLFVSNFQNK